MESTSSTAVDLNAKHPLDRRQPVSPGAPGGKPGRSRTPRSIDKINFYSGERELDEPLGAVQMGLIYVNPEGPNGKPDPPGRGHGHSRNVPSHGDERRRNVALIAGGNTFGKCHGAVDQDQYVGPEPEAAPLEQQGLGWKNSFGNGHGVDTFTRGPEDDAANGTVPDAHDPSKLVPVEELPWQDQNG